MEKIYNKLVRDNIPEIIRGNGEEPICRVLSDTEYWNFLLRKDEEESIEVKEANSVEERKRELASIKVLGFYDNEVYNYVSRENKLLTFIGMILGCLIGYILTIYIIKTCELDITMLSPKISIYSYIYSLGIIKHLLLWEGI